MHATRPPHWGGLALPGGAGVRFTRTFGPLTEGEVIVTAASHLSRACGETFAAGVTRHVLQCLASLALVLGIGGRQAGCDPEEQAIPAGVLEQAAALLGLATTIKPIAGLPDVLFVQQDDGSMLALASAACVGEGAAAWTFPVEAPGLAVRELLPAGLDKAPRAPAVAPIDCFLFWSLPKRGWLLGPSGSAMVHFPIRTGVAHVREAGEETLAVIDSPEGFSSTIAWVLDDFGRVLGVGLRPEPASGSPLLVLPWSSVAPHLDGRQGTVQNAPSSASVARALVLAAVRPDRPSLAVELASAAQTTGRSSSWGGALMRQAAALAAGAGRTALDAWLEQLPPDARESGPVSLVLSMEAAEGRWPRDELARHFDRALADPRTFWQAHEFALRHGALLGDAAVAAAQQLAQERPPPRTPGLIVREAERCWRGKSWACVVELLEPYEAIWPVAPEVAFLLADAHLGLEDAAECKRICMKILPLIKRRAPVHLALAECESIAADGDANLGLRHVEAAVAIGRETVESLLLRGEFLGRLDRWKSAIEALRAAIALDPQAVRAWMLWGLAADRFGNQAEYDKALAMLRSLDAEAAEQLQSMTDEE